jgi:aspartate carbamoyltransferase regulatory subunit
MIKEEEKLIVRRIKEGTVIDHISPGSSLNVLKVLGITGEEGMTVALVMNVPSRKMGKKDIVKIEGRELTQDQVDKIALISPMQL